jgi:hypothetical protein
VHFTLPFLQAAAPTPDAEALPVMVDVYHLIAGRGPIFMLHLKKSIHSHSPPRLLGERRRDQPGHEGRKQQTK